MGSHLSSGITRFWAAKPMRILRQMARMTQAAKTQLEKTAPTSVRELDLPALPMPELLAIRMPDLPMPELLATRLPDLPVPATPPS